MTAAPSHQALFKALAAVVPAPGETTAPAMAVIDGATPLHLEHLYSDGAGEEAVVVLSLAQFTREDDERAPNPDVVLRVYPTQGLAEPLSYEDTHQWERVYSSPDCPNVAVRTAISLRVLDWLQELATEGLRFVPDEAMA